MVFTKLHAGGKFGGGSYNATGGLHGVGASVVNALSARLDVEVDRSPATQRMSFQRGVPGVFDGDGPDGRRSPPQSGLHKGKRVAKGVTGTRIRFWPDRQIFTKDATFVFDELVTRARQTSFIVPGPGAGDPRPARRGAGRGAVQARRRDHGVLRVPRPRRAGHRGAPAAGRTTGSPRPCRCSTTRAT